MATRRRFLGGIVAAAVLAGCSDDRLDPGEAGTEEFDVGLPAFGAEFDPEYTCDGDDLSPPVKASGVPVEAEALALVLDDPDAPSEEPFVHWLLWNVPAGSTEIPEDVPGEVTVDSPDGAAQGTNDFGEVGYRGPCPPAEDNPHSYRLTLTALDATIEVEPGADRTTLEAALDDHRIDEATVRAEYDR
jgi:Raf kinase inhibitor-like YbhB/YbcL family protein